MTRKGTHELQEDGLQGHGAEVTENGAPSASSVVRRPYRAPQLRHLGSVRELTLGATMGMPEGGGTFQTMGM